jgi:hypothetical protein
VELVLEGLGEGTRRNIFGFWGEGDPMEEYLRILNGKSVQNVPKIFCYLWNFELTQRGDELRHFHVAHGEICGDK